MEKFKTIGAIIAIIGALTVVLGAFGAHTLSDKLTESQLAVFKTGVLYQFIHVIASLIVIVIAVQIDKSSFIYVLYFFIAGMILFSGSLYLLSCKEILGLGSFSKVLGPITPLGGLSFIIGWIILAIKLLR